MNVIVNLMAAVMIIPLLLVPFFVMGPVGGLLVSILLLMGTVAHWNDCNSHAVRRRE